MVRFEDDNGNVMATGVSVCSMSDGYNKNLGARIASGRAVVALKEEEEIVAPHGLEVISIVEDGGIPLKLKIDQKHL